MIRQYNPQRFRTLPDGRRVGTIDIGTIFRLARNPREPFIVLAWLNRTYSAARRVNGRWIDTMMAGGHLAQIRSLRTGRVSLFSDCWILRVMDA